MPNIYVEEKDALVEFPDGTSSPEMEMAIDKFFFKPDRPALDLGEVGKQAVRSTENLIGSVGSIAKWAGSAFEDDPLKTIAGAVGVPVEEFAPDVGRLPITSFAGIGEEWLRKGPKELEGLDFVRKIGNKLTDKGDAWYQKFKKLQQSTEFMGMEIATADPATFKGSFMENPSWTRGVAAVAAAVPSLFTAASVTMVTGNPLAAGAVLGFSEGVGQREEALEAGKSKRVAGTIGMVSSIGNTILETIALGKIFGFGASKKAQKMTVNQLRKELVKSFKGKQVVKVFKGIAQGANIEGLQEVEQGLLSNFIARFGYEPTRKLTEGLVEAYIGGAGSGGMLGGFTSQNGKVLEATIDELKVRGATDQDIQGFMNVVQQDILNNAEVIDTVITEQADRGEPIVINEQEEIDFDEAEKTYEDVEDVFEPVDIKVPDDIKAEVREEQKVKKEDVSQPPVIIQELQNLTQKINDITTANEQVPRSLLKRHEVLKTTLEGLATKQKSLKGIKGIIKEQTGGKIDSVTLTEISLLKDKFKNIERGVKQGKKVALAEVAEVQKAVSDLVNKSDVEVDDRGAFMTMLRGVKTQEQLQKAMPKIQTKIDKILAEAQKSVDISAFKKMTKKSVVNKLRPEYKTAIEEIISDLDPVKHGKKKISKLKSLAEFIEREPENNIPQPVLNELKLLDKKSLKDMTPDEVRTIVDSIGHLLKLNALKNKLIVKGKVREFDALRNRAVTNVGQNSQTFDESISGLDSTQKQQEAPFYKKIFGDDSYNTELLSEILDGSDGNVIQQVMYDGIDKGVDEQLSYEHNTEDYFRKELEGIDVKKWSTSFQKKGEDVERTTVNISNGRKISLTKSEKVAFLLHTLNDLNLKHIKEGGISFSSTPSRIIKLSEEDITAITETLTSEERRVANIIHTFFNVNQKSVINTTSVELDGYEIAREGNYFPIRTNFLDRLKIDLFKGRNFMRKTLEGIGIFKERQNASNAIILDDAFIAVYKSMKQVSAYVGLASPMRSARALINDNDFRTAIIDAGKGNYIKNFLDYLDKIEGNSIRLDNVERLTQDFINKLDAGLLGLNPFVMLKQPISYLAASTEIDAKYLGGSFKAKATDEEIAEIKRFSPQLRDRFDGNVTREMGEVASVGRPLKFFTGEESISSKVMSGIKAFDMSAIASIWRAVKQEVSDKNPELTGNEYLQKVADRAWFVIRRTQPTFHVKDRSAIGRSEQIWTRLATKYSSQRNKNWMMLRRASEKYNRSHKTPNDIAKFAGSLFTVTFISPLLLMLIDDLRDIVYGRDKKQSMFEKMFINVISKNLGNIYIIGRIMDSLISKIKVGSFAGYGLNDPVQSTMDSIINVFADGFKGVTQAISGERYVSGRQAGEKKWKKTAKKLFISGLDVGGTVSGFNIKTVRKTGGGILRITGEIAKFLGI